ncbi:sterigmatocystin 8-O-methyltransferase precursor, putative [Beauveria bassiana ARSEF 2860]|uniref:Sterigmatocystin 8-O-methyltransferase, putative n=1 Tax=Beauveria bassiana (strain ARSEF 2860) TaxID=655819 RepID=J4UQ21_BEAB2|nr:sterigmatocystin 8-O-methyltransferase precursor, putative [Beauveria bassiana ARSEF 2860]EJP67382.1 sterigmatocystin 8-O-methyltransferase precursor, putative [Beauveria bassiana ARSEF 2860]
MALPSSLTPIGDVDALIAQLQAIVADPKRFAAAAAIDDTTRQQLKQLTRAASVALEEPFETVQRLAYSAEVLILTPVLSQPLPLITTRIAQRHNIFATLVAGSQQGQGQGPVSFGALKEATGLQDAVLESLLDYLGSQGMLSQPVRGQYAAIGLTQLMTAPLLQDAIIHFHDNCLPAFAALNTVLSSPPSQKLNAFEVGQHSTVDFYTWLETHPTQQGAFHRFMEAQFASLPTWLDAVDFASELGGGAGLGYANHVVFVDVGGGNGQQIAALKEKFPELKGRAILQDRPEVLEKALEVDGMEKMNYDYLTEQPVKDACVYYFRQIMHNNDDATCIRILQSQLPAMGPSSVIVIDDKCLSDDKPPQDAPGVEYTAALSIAMKVMFNAQERREAHWRALLSEAGLAIKHVRRFTKFEDSVIIAAKQCFST